MTLFKIRPAAVSTTYDAWTLAAGASKVLAVDPGVSYTDDDATTYITVTAASAAKQGFTLSTRPELATLTSLTVRARGASAFTGGDLPVLSCFIRLGGNDGATFFVVGLPDSTYTTGTSANMVAWKPLGGGLYGQLTVEDLYDPTFEIVFYISDWIGHVGPADARFTTFWVEATGTATPTQDSQAREIASRWLRLRRRRSRMFTLKNVSPAALDIDPLGEFALTHQAVPNASGAGAGDLNWQRRLLRAMPATFDLDNLNFPTFTARDLRRDLVTFWDTGIAVRPGPTAHGVARVDIGNGRTYTRASKGWVRDTGAVIREVVDDQEMLNRLGMAMHRPSSNLLPQSSFRNGTGAAFTGWTLTAGSGTFSEETTTLLFDPAVSSRAMRITAGSPHAVESTAVSTPTAVIAANTKVTVFYDNVGTASALWRVQRSVGPNTWWRQSDQTWQLAVTTNAVGGNWLNLPPIDVGAAPVTLTFTFVLPVGTTAASYAILQHVQLEDLPWFSSRIVTDTVAVTRAQCRLLISNNGAARFWRRNSGTAFFGFQSLWSTTNTSAAAYVFVLASCVFDANNWMKVYYDSAAGQWVFQRRAAGVNYNATFTRTMAVLDQVMVTIRWAGIDAELGLTALTQSIFVNGVKGTDVVSVRPTQVTPIDAGIGCEAAGANTADGNIHDVAFTEQVLTDQEIAWVSSSGGSW